ncbi:MAG: hypothetical protein PWQ12_101 [Clostridiales bacterium]|jgi:hypothetical protein|nr:hypothetical protein [Clostridiales bacterium]
MDDRRKERRYENLGVIESFNFHMSNRTVEINAPVEISLKDISMGGLGIRSNKALEVGTTLSIHLQLDRDSTIVIGKVVWCRYDGSFFNCGLKLIYMPDELIDFLEVASEEGNKYMN